MWSRLSERERRIDWNGTWRTGLRRLVDIWSWSRMTVWALCVSIRRNDFYQPEHADIALLLRSSSKAAAARSDATSHHWLTDGCLPANGLICCIVGNIFFLRINCPGVFSCLSPGCLPMSLTHATNVHQWYQCEPNRRTRMQLTQLACQCFASNGCKNQRGSPGTESFWNGSSSFSTVLSTFVWSADTVLKKGKCRAALLGCWLTSLWNTSIRWSFILKKCGHPWPTGCDHYWVIWGQTHAAQADKCGSYISKER